MRIEHRHEVTLAPRDDCGGVDVAAHRVDGRLELGERAACHDLRAVDGQPRAAGGGDALVDAIERRLALLGPLRALCRAGGELLRKADVPRDLCAQRGGAGGKRRWRRAAEVALDRSLQGFAGAGDGTEVRGAGRLCVLADRAVVRDQLLEHCARAVGERLMLALHAARRLQGFAGRAGGELLAGHQHRGERGESQTQAPADPEARRAQAPHAA